VHGEEVIAQRAASTLVLLHLGSGQYYSLDEVGIRVWELCDGAHNIPEIVSIICQEYAAPAEQVERDVRDLVEDLSREHLLNVGGRSPTSAPQPL
jgi:hypothetical protein